jgi:hypothetical protein
MPAITSIRVSLGDDTDQFLAIHHEQRSDVILSHFCDRVEEWRPSEWTK